jgi:hypothetical protein
MQDALIIIAVVVVVTMIVREDWCPICLWYLLTKHRENAVCLTSFRRGTDAALTKENHYE